MIIKSVEPKGTNKGKMKFEEIFNNEGLYTSDDFVPGFCFRVMNETLYGVQYKNEQDIFPSMETFCTHKGLFSKKYKKVFTTKQLFGPK